MNLSNLLGVTFAVIVSTIALLHFYWALGNHKGTLSAVPTRDGQPLFKPSSLATASVGVALLLAAALSLEYIDVFALSLPPWLTSLGMWTLGAVFLLRAVGDFRYVGFFKRHTNTRFARLDTLFYSPLCLLLAVLVFGVIFTASPLE